MVLGEALLMTVYNCFMVVDFQKNLKRWSSEIIWQILYINTVQCKC